MLSNAGVFRAGSSSHLGVPARYGAVQSAEAILLPTSVPQVLSPSFPPSFLGWLPRILGSEQIKFPKWLLQAPEKDREEMSYTWSTLQAGVWRRWRAVEVVNSQAGWQRRGGGSGGGGAGQVLIEEFDIWALWCQNLKISKKALTQSQQHSMSGGSSGSLPWRKGRRTRLKVRSIEETLALTGVIPSPFPGFLSPSLFWSFVCYCS